MGVTSPSLSEGPLESLDDTLTESMLSPELPVGGERGVSLTGELAALLSVPRNSLEAEVQIREACWQNLCRSRTDGGTHRLSLFTMLFRGLGDVGLLSPGPSTSQDKA